MDLRKGALTGDLERKWGERAKQTGLHIDGCGANELSSEKNHLFNSCNKSLLIVQLGEEKNLSNK